MKEHVFAIRVARGLGLSCNSVNFDLIRTVFSERYKLIYYVLRQLLYVPVDFSGSAMWRELKQLNDDNE